MLSLSERKVIYLLIFSINKRSTFFSSNTLGNSRPQNQAIALAVEEAVLLDFQDQPSKQGSAVSGWILLDYGKFSLTLALSAPFLPCLPSTLSSPLSSLVLLLLSFYLRVLFSPFISPTLYYLCDFCISFKYSPSLSLPYLPLSHFPISLSLSLSIYLYLSLYPWNAMTKQFLSQNPLCRRKHLVYALSTPNYLSSASSLPFFIRPVVSLQDIN
jgi:hypothetical protein